MKNQSEEESESLVDLDISNITEEHIKAALRECLRLNPLIRPSNSLVVTVFTILKEFFIADKQYIILEAPTGSGKTIIGFMVHFCYSWLVHHAQNEEKIYLKKNAEGADVMTMAPVGQPVSYFLTSSKMLQEQIDADLDRFGYRDYITMLKGTSNYVCEFLTNTHTGDIVYYPERYCLGMKGPAIAMLGCRDKCEYKNKRDEAADADCTVLNYSYFLNVMKGQFNPFFGVRALTIADEAHLIPEIVLNQFNYEISKYVVNRIQKVVDGIAVGFGSDLTTAIRDLLPKAHSFFMSPLISIQKAMDYYELLAEIFNNLREIKSVASKRDPGFDELFGKSISSIEEDLSSLDDTRASLQQLIDERPNDAYFSSEEVVKDRGTGVKVYKHTIRDLSEASMVRKNFLSKVSKCLMMSATLGDVDEFATLMGLEKSEYTGWRLASTFDFSKSPIYICKSGWLNYNNFQNNIDKVVMDCLKICNDLHPNHKGIIHTSTFTIANKIQDKIYLGLVNNPSRFLFYRTSEEKEKLIELQKTSNEPFVVVGPSLYEGLDLKQDQGRFNILVKVPYAGLDDYLRKKIERYPFWYERNTLEKIVQAIGRTNREVDDWSVVYLLDSGFEKMIVKTNQYIVDRLQYKVIR